MPVSRQYVRMVFLRIPTEFPLSATMFQQLLRALMTNATSTSSVRSKTAQLPYLLPTSTILGSDSVNSAPAYSSRYSMADFCFRHHQRSPSLSGTKCISHGEKRSRTETFSKTASSAMEAYAPTLVSFRSSRLQQFQRTSHGLSFHQRFSKVGCRRYEHHMSTLKAMLQSMAIFEKHSILGIALIMDWPASVSSNRSSHQEQGP